MLLDAMKRGGVPNDIAPEPSREHIENAPGSACTLIGRAAFCSVDNEIDRHWHWSDARGEI